MRTMHAIYYSSSRRGVHTCVCVREDGEDGGREGGRRGVQL